VTDVVVVHRATHGQPWLNRRKIASSTISQKGMMLRVFSPPVSGTTPAQPYLRDPHARFCKLQLQSSASAQGPNGTALALRDFDLGGAKPILPGGRSVRCSLLNQQAFRLEKKFEMDHGPSHSTRPGLPRSFAIRLARRGQVGSVSSSE
jgi:hypothetical protein